jgi:hypothetical protein
VAFLGRKQPARVGGANVMSREIEQMRLYYKAFLRERLAQLLTHSGDGQTQRGASRQAAVPTDLAQDDDPIFGNL